MPQDFGTFGGLAMRKLLIGGIGLLSAIVVMDMSAPAIADEDVAKPRRERAAPRRAAPQRQVEQPRQQPAQASNWSGGQVGGSNGASSVNNTFVEPGAYLCPFGTEFGVDCFETPLVFSDRKLVYTAGAFAGYRMQFGWAVVGVEGDINFKSADSTSSLTVFTCFDPPFCELSTTETKAGTIKQNWDGSIRGRFGVLVTPWTLLYATAGVAFGEFKGSFFYKGLAFDESFDCCIPVGSATAAGTWRDVRTGATVGAGIETEVWSRVKARLEYRYTDFGTYTKNLPVTTICDASFPCDTPSSNVSIDLKGDFHRVMVGLGFDLF
jgi:outer membrane immunogenic protein